MKIKQLYTGCLSEAAYYIESEGEVAIIDPLRETAPYLEMVKESNSNIKYIFETHFHADFVSGHVDLANKTGATIVFGPNADTAYNIHSAKDGEELKLGKLTIKVLHTPGHTMESTCYLLIDENGKNHAIFTGDTLFIGDVGRPDLAVKTDLTVEDLAGHLYDSLHNKILPLEDDVIVYPAHGAGSACGKNLSKETFATLGNQKQFNYALQPMSKADFVATVTEGLGNAPQYFPENVMLNKKGYDSLDLILERGLRALSIEDFEAERAKGTLVLDTRAPQTFNKAFIPGAINIGLKGSFAPWVGALIVDTTRPILLVADTGTEEEVITRLARVGYDNVVGHLAGGMEAWMSASKEVQTVNSISATQLADLMAQNSELKVLDVRNPGEYISEHLLGAENIPLGELSASLGKLDQSGKSTYYVHCAGGYRSMIASSILKQAGFDNFIEVAGGYAAIKETTAPRTEYVCPSTIK